MQHLGVNFGGIWRFELFLYLGFYFLLRKSGLILKVQWQHCCQRGNAANAHVGSTWAFVSEICTPRAMYVVQCHYLSV